MECISFEHAAFMEQGHMNNPMCHHIITLKLEEMVNILQAALSVQFLQSNILYIDTNFPIHKVPIDDELAWV